VIGGSVLLIAADRFGCRR